MKVPPSTSALPVGSSSGRSWSGSMPYLTGENSAAMAENMTSAVNNSGSDASTKPSTENNAAAISTSFSFCATEALS